MLGYYLCIEKNIKNVYLRWLTILAWEGVGCLIAFMLVTKINIFVAICVLIAIFSIRMKIT
jgi:hypothetical protein